MSNDIGDDELISLAKAAELFFRGEIKKSSLRTEARKGNLEIFRIANKDFVTRNAIRRMVERCKLPSPVSSTATSQNITAKEAARLRLAALKRNE
ncbi:hypothetical protein CN106_01540 [Sinorhizobium meliloti]|uniref:hypothetical protein n=1 Tax=Rhizobium meliloti TaxID=382 RepID=UPI000FD74983|nr:hypothetical protein [Sinorhizobium meliloti]RVM54074.1 hypothetical protein CN127_06425 [Sinorhizobium meliloti]RVN75655.1 hypothetical protein CN106_01540 [Sinorhizobium meliloti]